MIAKSAGCYYGVHFGCICAARDPRCLRCAERLTNAVNYTLRPSVDDRVAPRTWTAPYAGSGAEARREKTAGTHLAGDHNALRDTELPRE